MFETTHDYLRDYSHAVAACEADPSDQTAQYSAVLALARCGSTQNALSEFNRFKLGDVRHHEDIMSLGGRLYKDLYLMSAGETALNHARESAARYEAAYKDSQGYYSGINSATMAFAANMPKDIVKDRARNILNALPASEDLEPETHYFIEATRAEALLLLEDINGSQASFRNAINFDPQNFTAHATTLKQFKLISALLDQSPNWLSEFQPPKAAHFAGHIFSTLGNDDTHLTPEQEAALKIEISNAIQSSDIGFGYGALAAGSDILIAETLLEEGAELNVILPTSQDIFLQQSIAPYGNHWVARFQACLDQAHSIKILSALSTWPHETLNRFAAQIAMGCASQRALTFYNTPTQLLLWDGKTSDRGTGQHAKDWAASGHETVHIPYPHPRPKPNLQNKNYGALDIKFDVARADDENIQYFETLDKVFDHLENFNQIASAGIGLDITISDGSKSPPSHAQGLADMAMPGLCLVSESIAALIALHRSNKFEARLIGQRGVDQDDAENIYGLTRVSAQ